MAGWRDRIDLTTNWAITVVGAMLSLSLSSPNSHHGIILLAMVLVTLMLTIEARRYRFFDVFRGRVRTLESNWYGAIFQSEVPRDQGWLEELGHDLQRPCFLIGWTEALSRRLRRTYVWIYFILLFAWVLKISSKQTTSTEPAHTLGSFRTWLENAAILPLPGWFVVACVAIFYGWLLYVGLQHGRTKTSVLHGDVHV